jgi:hypothetical protein
MEEVHPIHSKRQLELTENTQSQKNESKKAKIEESEISKEETVGITLFIGDQKDGFTGILKQRYAFVDWSMLNLY